MQHIDETPGFWLNMPIEQVADHAARLQAFHRRTPTDMDIARMIATRVAFSAWLKGEGIEVGAGARPFDVGPHLKVRHSDIRDSAGLRKYHGESCDPVGAADRIDAQTFGGVPSESVDFVLSAHVIEHLFDPIGSIEQAIRVLKPGGFYLVAVPDMRFTFDRERPLTPLSHLVADHRDGGEGTRLQAFVETAHYSLGHTLEEAETLAATNMAAGVDIHVHCWTTDSFREMLAYCESIMPMRVEAGVLNHNEGLFALRRL